MDDWRRHLPSRIDVLHLMVGVPGQPCGLWPRILLELLHRRKILRPTIGEALAISQTWPIYRLCCHHVIKYLHSPVVYHVPKPLHN